ncbi:WXG100 family type VII secretion target [Cellulosimicrobium arenosum]|uniref:ESAT-6-like protein n=1 Tax=Cellulosimicrobium arenosum TaxID=2708133 RepID=A0A927G9T6_9MICO|nr:WXG100 family type VII secretion target [Cellulosimicrobium arenosum]MBD8079062.1 WXG100 family type VII secretion target [Cellulosimicrobium arenosum]
MSRYAVDSMRVSQASTAVSTSVATIRTDVATMMRQLDDLKDCWTGSAAIAFAGVMAQWQTTQTQMESSLDAITAALGSTATIYDDAEAQAARLFTTR